MRSTSRWDEGAGAAHSSESIFAGMEAALDKGELEKDYSVGDADAALRGAVQVVERTLSRALSRARDAWSR